MGQCLSAGSGIVRNPENKLKRRASQRTSIFNRRASRLSSIDLSLIADEYRDLSEDKFQLKELKFQGTFKTQETGKKDQRIGKSIEHGIRKFKAHPNLYYAMFYPTEMKEWPENEQQYVYLYRAGLQGFKPNGVSPKGNVTLLTQEYQPLVKFRGDTLPKKHRDDYTDTILSKYEGKNLHHTSKNQNLPLLPGRGMGCCDEPNIQLIGNDIDPSSIRQGQIGDCWLLSGIASLAEYDGAIERLFRKTKHVHKLPNDSPNRYTITLYDLKTWKEVDIVVDERLCCRSDGTGRTIGVKPTEDNELWICYLEKAIAVHCGGWDKIDGGHCTHAWSLLTGVKEQYIITKKEGTSKFVCGTKYNSELKKWEEQSNAPNDGYQGNWVVPWPKVGGGGTKPLSQKQLFKRLCKWDDTNYLIGASSKGTSDESTTNGIVDNHAYSVVDCRNNVADTGMDLIQVRNPWGYGGIKKSKFGRNGIGWKKYPEIKKEIKPIFGSIDDGLFWLTRQEFFEHYDSIYLGAANLDSFINRK